MNHFYGDSILVLSGIIGGYRSNDGDPEKSFNGRDYSGGEKMFRFIPVKNDDGDVIEFNLVGIGTMHVLNLAG